MGKLTEKQARELAELQALAEAPDDELELYVKDERGRETRLTGSHAQKWLKTLGLGDDDEESAVDKAKDDEGAPDKAEDDKPPAAKTPKWFR
jgi:hypothetical protein